jgi:hypothetical protein
MREKSKEDIKWTELEHLFGTPHEETEEKKRENLIYSNVPLDPKINEKISKLRTASFHKRNKRHLLNINVDFEVAANGIDCEILKTNGEIGVLQNKLKKLIESKEKVLKKDPSFEPASYTDGTFILTLNQSAYDDLVSREALLKEEEEKRENLLKIERDIKIAEFKKQSEEIASIAKNKKTKKDLYTATFWVISSLVGGYLFTNGHYSYFVAGIFSALVIANYAIEQD